MKIVSSHNIYLDSSGDSGWPTPWGKSQNSHYVLAGVAMTPQMDHEAHLEVRRISEKYLGKTWGGWHELNYSSLIYRKKPYDKLTHTLRKSLADEVFNLILKLNPVVFATVVDKVKMKKRYAGKAINPKEYAFRAIAGRCSMFLKRKDALGYLVMDTEEYRKDRELQSLVHYARKSGINITGFAYRPTMDYLEMLLNTVTFVPSEMSPGVQLTDFCAHSIFKHFERGKSDRYHQIEPLFDKDNGRVYEPSVVPT